MVPPACRGYPGGEPGGGVRARAFQTHPSGPARPPQGGTHPDPGLLDEGATDRIGQTADDELLELDAIGLLQDGGYEVSPADVAHLMPPLTRPGGRPSRTSNTPGSASTTRSPIWRIFPRARSGAGHHCRVRRLRQGARAKRGEAPDARQPAGGPKSRSSATSSATAM